MQTAKVTYNFYAMTIEFNPPVRRVEWVEASAPRLTYDDFIRLAPALPLYTHEHLQVFCSLFKP